MSQFYEITLKREEASLAIYLIGWAMSAGVCQFVKPEQILNLLKKLGVKFADKPEDLARFTATFHCRRVK